MTDLLVTIGLLVLFVAVWIYVYYRFIGTTREKRRDAMSGGFGLASVAFLWFWDTHVGYSSGHYWFWVNVAVFALGVIVMIYGARQRAKPNNTADEPEPSTEEDSP